MKDLTFDDLVKWIEDSRKADVEHSERIRRQDIIDERNDKKRRKEILSQRHVHAKCDELEGLYPMTKEKLLERIKMINSSNVMMDSYGNIVMSVMGWAMFGLELLDVNDSDRLYDYYLTDVKPYIF
jgi:hypothetical protein